jgi:hypothetical protein
MKDAGPICTIQAKLGQFCSGQTFRVGLQGSRVTKKAALSSAPHQPPSDTSYWSTISGPTWTNPGYPLSSNFFLWESAIEIQWNERDISTLTVWDSATGPSGAVVSPPDPSVYPFSEGPLQITRSFTDCGDLWSGCGAALGPGGAPGLGTKAISAIVGGALGGVILVLVVGCCILRGQRRRLGRV